MIDKILKIFFVKNEKKKENAPLTIIKRAETVLGNRTSLVTSRKEVNTCLSAYFIGHRGLNLIERGHCYSLSKIAHNQR